MRTARSQNAPDEVWSWSVFEILGYLCPPPIECGCDGLFGTQNFWVCTDFSVCVLYYFAIFVFLFYFVIFVWRESWYLRTLTPVGVVVSPRSGGGGWAEIGPKLCNCICSISLFVAWRCFIFVRLVMQYLLPLPPVRGCG